MNDEVSDEMNDEMDDEMESEVDNKVDGKVNGRVNGEEDVERNDEGSYDKTNGRIAQVRLFWVSCGRHGADRVQDDGRSTVI